MVLGIALVFLAREVAEETPLVDWFVMPLLTSDTTARADVMVVMGAGITGSCTPNHSGLQRVLLAADLYHQRRAPVVLFTGGLPAGFSCTIAEAMAAMAERLGVRREDIRTEESSRS